MNDWTKKGFSIRNGSQSSGANFIIDWYSSKPLRPLFQAVMVGGLGAQAFSFTTEGIEMERMSE
ncbi:DUF3124 domain-containing protein [Pricia sp.]|uniref:DUF3124 domain-containing protein n=1 Tax=Pricia sp. TaxID=2268138 RepID=UPI00359417D6